MPLQPQQIRGEGPWRGVCESIGIFRARRKALEVVLAFARIVGSKRRFIVGLASAFIGVVPGCANLIGLGDFGVAGGSATGASGSANAGASTLADAGSGAEAGSDAEAGSSGTSTAGTSGSAGAAGTGAAVCPSNCDDQNDCTDDSCVSGACKNQPLAAGTACGTGRTCDDQAVCVRCRDTVAGSGKDEGCTTGAPVCTGTGAAATCAGCTKDADCDDGNDCTTEQCTTGSCVFSPVAAGQACAMGVCNGTANAEKCVACSDSAVAPSTDPGCTSAKPACDTSSTPTCYACVKDADCASDGVSCTDETCVNHACMHVPDDSKCTPSGDQCNPNRCDAVAGCKAVDVHVAKPVVNAMSTLGNGSFEIAGSDPQSAVGWTSAGAYYIITDCTDPGCQPASNAGTIFPDPNGADFLAWMGGPNDAGVAKLTHLMTLPAGTTKLLIQADTNFETKSAAVTNKDLFQVRLLDSTSLEIGGPVASFSNVNAQLGNTNVWTPNGINATVDATPLAGQDVYLQFWSSVDTTLPTDFFIDNVRVTATVCE